jgi:hypothetical protein
VPSRSAGAWWEKFANDIERELSEIRNLLARKRNLQKCFTQRCGDAEKDTAPQALVPLSRLQPCWEGKAASPQSPHLCVSASLREPTNPRPSGERDTQA